MLLHWGRWSQLNATIWAIWGLRSQGRDLAFHRISSIGDARPRLYSAKVLKFWEFLESLEVAGICAKIFLNWKNLEIPAVSLVRGRLNFNQLPGA